MDALRKSGTPTIVAIVALLVLAIGFWALLYSPKRGEVKKLDAQVSQVEASLSEHRAEIAEAEQARGRFPVDYQQLVVLGKAVPNEDDTASLLVQLNRLADESKVRFKEFSLEGESGEAAPAPTTGESVPPTEAAASLMPLGASVGPAGLAVMPYSLSFEGGWFQVADFIRSLDSLVKTQNEKVSVDGRLITIDGFSLAPEQEEGSSAIKLNADFHVTTYLTPPAQGTTAGATPEGPEAAAPASTTTGGAP